MTTVKSRLGGLAKITGKGWFRLLLLVAMLYLFVRFVDLSLLAQLQPMDLVLIFIFVGLANMTQYLFISFVMEIREVRLMFSEWCGLGVCSNLLNLVLPFQSGLALKAIYLKKVHQLSYTHFVGIQGLFTVLRGITYLGLAFILLCWLPVDWRITLGAAGVFLVSLLPLFFGQITWQPRQRFLKMLLEAYHYLHDLNRNRRMQAKVVGNAILSLLALALAMYFTLRGMNDPVSFDRVVLVIVSLSLVNLINITPGNLGVQELASGLIFDILGADFQRGLVGILVVRAVSILFNVLLFPFFFNRFKGYRSSDEEKG